MKQISEQQGAAAVGRAWAALTRDRYVFLVLVVFILMLAALSVLSPNFLTARNLMNVLHQMSIMMIVGIGMTYVVIGGGFDLSVGSVVALSGSLAGVVMTGSGVIAGIAAGLAVGLLFGMFNGTLVSRLQISPFLATLGSLVIARGLALGVTGGSAVFGLPAAFTWLGGGKVAGIPVPVILAAALAIVGAVVLHNHRFGLQVFAVGGNREAARLTGVPVQRVLLLTYSLSGLMAGTAGLVLAARIRAGEPTAAVFLELFTIAAVVLGGTSLQGGQGSVWRTVLGVLFIGFLQNGLNLMNVQYYWQQVIIGSVFILAASLGMIRWRS